LLSTLLLCKEFLQLIHEVFALQSLLFRADLLISDCQGLEIACFLKRYDERGESAIIVLDFLFVIALLLGTIIIMNVIAHIILGPHPLLDIINL
jgi:hypothetical protein